MKTIIFSDLDGTLLHPGDYSYDAAESSLERIRREGIPLVFSSSKTRAEIEAIRARMGNTHPYIAENGGVVMIPIGYFPFKVAGEIKGDYHMITLGRPYNEIREVLNEAKKLLGADIKGFGDMSAKEVARLTGLSPFEAGLAKKREFDEPFILKNGWAEKTGLFEFLDSRGINCTEGRLFHATGRHDKGSAMRILKDLFRAVYGKIIIIAVGDALNDLPLLKEADYPVLVRKKDGSYEGIDVPGLIKADGIGPAGWDKAVTGILDSISSSERGYTC